MSKKRFKLDYNVPNDALYQAVFQCYEVLWIHFCERICITDSSHFFLFLNASIALLSFKVVDVVVVFVVVVVAVVVASNSLSLFSDNRSKQPLLLIKSKEEAG